MTEKIEANREGCERHTSAPEPPEERGEHVAALLMKHRSSLLAFILLAMRDVDAAEDVLQEVAVAVIENATDFQPGTNFRAWAREIARRRILAHWRLSQRKEQILTDEQLGQLTAGFNQMETVSLPEEHTRALRFCLDQVKPFAEKILRLRYHERLSLCQIAQRVDRQPESVRKALYRGRIALRECIDRRLSGERLGEMR